MRSRIRRNISFANVMSSIAVFIALGGGAYAVATINGADIINNSVTGKDVKERTLKAVCPGNASTKAPTHVCFGAQRPAADWDVAARACAAANLRLPSIGEALLVTDRVNTGDTFLWTDEVTDVSGGANDRAIVRTNDVLFSRIGNRLKTTLTPYRCVTTAR